MPFEIDIGVAKTNKWASRESGDTAEVAERPGGGFSLVVVDGQGSGAAAKAVSLMLTTRAVSLLKDGVRDGAVARAVHDHLMAYRRGQISASLDIVSVDAESRQIVVTRNGTTPFVVVRDAHVPEVIHPGEGAIGRYRFTRPSVWTMEVEHAVDVWVVTDGVTGAGRTPERHLALRDAVAACASGSASERALALLERAMDADDGRPKDDMTVGVVSVRPTANAERVRRLALHAALP